MIISSVGREPKDQCRGIPSVAHSAFTLAENLFAMAILAFALLSIIGLMPSTLSELNDAERRLAEARILQTLSTEFQTKSWKSITTQPQQRYYFDKRGVKTSAPNTGANPADYPALAAVVYMEPAPTLPGDTATGSGSPGAYLRKLTIVITPQVNSPTALQKRFVRGTNRVYASFVASQVSDQEMNP